MFSGLTNQVSNWMKKKQDRDVSASPEGEEQSTTSSPKDVIDVQNLEAKETGSPRISRLEMFGNVKNQMTNWLGGGIASLRKASKSDETTDTAVVDAESAETDASIRGSINDADDEDNSSATGGADSVAPISDEEAEDDSVPSGVSSKALESAKNLGSFLYSAVNKAGKTVSEAGVKIKKSVEENSILGDFNKEQEEFIKQKEVKTGGTAMPPWSGCPNEVALKEQCLALSTDKKNFVRSPPAGADFKFNYEITYPVAMATLAEDANLEAMRFELVPRVISEEKFWRNYFYRVGLICQANELSSMAASEEQASRKRSEDENADDREWEKELDEEVCDFEVVNDAEQDSEWKTMADKTTLEDFPDLK